MAIYSLQKLNKLAEEQPLVGMLVYTVLGFLRPVVQIFLVPLYLSLFTEAEYGIYDLMFITGNLLMIVVTLRINAAMFTYYYDYLGDKAQTKKYLQSTFSASCGIGLVFFFIFYVIGGPLFEMMFKSDEIQYFPYGCLVVAYAIVGEINACYYIYLKNEKNLIRYFIVMASQLLGAIFLQLFFIVVVGMGVMGAFVGYLVSNVVNFLLILCLEKNILTLNIDWGMVKKSMKYALALMPYLLIYWVLTKGGKIVLERYTDLPTVAVFALLVTLSTLVVLLVEAVVNGVRPFLFEIFASPQDEQSSNRVGVLTQMIVLVPLFSVPTIVLVGNNIGWVTSKATYADIAQYSSVVTLVTYLLVYGKLFYQQLMFVKRSDVVTGLSFIVMLCLTLGLFFLVPQYKIWGVLASTLIANAVMAILFFLAAQKYLYVAYDYKVILFLPLIVFGLLYGMEYFLIYGLELNRSSFGIIQFVILMPLIALMNLKVVKSYKRLFLDKD